MSASRTRADIAYASICTGRSISTRLTRHRNAAGAVLERVEAVRDHDVAAAVLGGIEGGVRGLDQLGGLLGFVRARGGDADADGHALMVRGPVRQGEVSDRRTHDLADL